VLFLPGLPAALATELLGPEAQPPAAPAGGRHRPSRIAPLYVDQLRRFVAAGGVAPPPGLADLVAARIALLPADTRRVLQAVAVLGDAAVAAQLVALLPDLTDLGRHLAELRRAGLTAANGGLHGVSHPLVRDVVLASTPRAVRRHLHSLARRDFGVDDLKIPPEAHALHAFHAGESFEALMLLEQLADRSAVRGDHQGRIRALRLALELGRRELGRGELDDPLSAVLIFSCKLGDALASVGQHNDADGVLSEALHLAGPSAEERPRLLASLASVARGRGLAEKADEYLSEALQLARQAGRRELIESLAQMRATWG
jgi:serine/threonine-protein kinase